MGVGLTVDVLWEHGGFASGEVSGVSRVLGVDKEVLVALEFELFFSQEGVFEQWWVLIPMNESVILL